MNATWYNTQKTFFSPAEARAGSLSGIICAITTVTYTVFSSTKILRWPAKAFRFVVLGTLSSNSTKRFKTTFFLCTWGWWKCPLLLQFGASSGHRSTVLWFATTRYWRWWAAWYQSWGHSSGLYPSATDRSTTRSISYWVSIPLAVMWPLKWWLSCNHLDKM